MVHTLERIAVGRFLNLKELQQFVNDSPVAKNLMNDNGTISTWFVDEFITLARNAGVSREVPTFGA